MIDEGADDGCASMAGSDGVYITVAALGPRMYKCSRILRFRLLLYRLQ